MKAKLLSVALLLAAVGNVQSRNVKFSIITFGKKAQVSIPSINKTVDLSPILQHKEVQTVTINDLPEEEFEYSYIIDGKPEPGVSSRKLPAGQNTTYNELVGRPETVSKLKGMGYPEDQAWTRSYGKTELFDDSYIPTVIIDNSNVPNYFTSPYDFGTKDDITKVPLNAITFILKESIFTDTNVSTSQKSRYNDKIQFKVKFNDNNKLYKRKALKFRAAGAEDPSYLGESLYADLAKTVGNPVHDKVFVRVYLKDGTPIGLYNVIDVTASKSFLKLEFNGDVKGKENKDQKEVGAIFDCHNADFESGMECENKKVEKNKEEKEEKKNKYTSEDERNDEKKLAALVKAMDKVDVNDEKSIKEFSDKWLDLDTFFKALSLEYLCGHWDSYWEYSNTVEVPISEVKAKRQEEGDVEGEGEGEGEGDGDGEDDSGKLKYDPEPEPERKPERKPETDSESKSERVKTDKTNTKVGTTVGTGPVNPVPLTAKKDVNKPTNYVLYQDPRKSTESTFKFFFVDQDFDQTFGVGKKVCGPSCSYKELISTHQVRAAKLFLKEGTLTRKMFDEHLKSIVQHAFNPVALGRRIDEYERRYATEIEWDFNDGTYHNRKDRDHKNRNTEHSGKTVSYSDHKRGLEDLREYIETRAKTVTHDLDFEWDPVPMDPVEKEIIVKDLDKPKKSDARMNKAISTSTILAVAVILFLQLLM